MYVYVYYFLNQKYLGVLGFLFFFFRKIKKKFIRPPFIPISKKIYIIYIIYTYHNYRLTFFTIKILLLLYALMYIYLLLVYIKSKYTLLTKKINK